MAATAWALYGHALEELCKGTIDLANDSFRMALVDGAYTPAQTTHTAWSDISANEEAGTGYTASGEAVTPTVTRSGLAVTFDCTDASWASSTITATYAVIVRDADANGTLAAGDIPIAYCELEDGATVSTTNGTLTVSINASGVYTITAAAAA